MLTFYGHYMKLLEEKYTEEKIRDLKDGGFVVYSNHNRIDLSSSYSEKVDPFDVVLTKELIIIDQSSYIPWFMDVTYRHHSFNPEIRKRLEDIVRKTNKDVKKPAMFVKFTLDPIGINVLNEKLDLPMDKIKTSLEELEKIIYQKN